MNPEFLQPRRCFLDPIPEIQAAAELLSHGLQDHLAGKSGSAARTFSRANDPKVREWLQSIWSGTDQTIIRKRAIADAPSIVPTHLRHGRRDPSPETKKIVLERDGYNCRFCGVPVVRATIRDRLRKLYPDAIPWPRRDEGKHAAFMCMWLQFDHIIPHSRGGDSSENNVLITCSACNYGRMESTLAEVGLLDPRASPFVKTAWRGLENWFQFLPAAPKHVKVGANVVSFHRELEARVPHTCGMMVCELCHHRELATARLGQKHFKCPACKKLAFVRENPILPDDGTWRAKCPSCGCQTFSVMQGTMMCSECGTTGVCDWLD